VELIASIRHAAGVEAELADIVKELQETPTLPSLRERGQDEEEMPAKAEEEPE